MRAILFVVVATFMDQWENLKAAIRKIRRK